ncbi:hypothetical protein HMPREF0058_0413 [Actinomyces urogenitalis DSM 15434]|uniref:Uncharacterized protein n=1 Tax=Actinomyces urogenitalis DSM 15434 TaxID=525246 RepID=C0W3G9_9ACTO|nr:hypothetical protein HMPREF0058_0413 [Actinomyces urogenitalis DSM 15434]
MTDRFVRAHVMLLSVRVVGWDRGVVAAPADPTIGAEWGLLNEGRAALRHRLGLNLKMRFRPDLR